MTKNILDSNICPSSAFRIVESLKTILELKNTKDNLILKI